MIFCIKMPNFIHIGAPNAKKDVISIFQDGYRGGSILLPLSWLLMSLSSEHQNMSVNQISSTYLNSRLRYNHFRFGKTNVCHIGILLPVSFQPHCHNPYDILHIAAKIHTYRTTHCGNVTSYQLFQDGRHGGSISRFLFVDVTIFRRSKYISKPNSVDVSQFRAEI